MDYGELHNELAMSIINVCYLFGLALGK